MLEQILTAYPDTVRVVYRNFSVNHPNSIAAIKAAEAAALQGEPYFWKMHDILFNSVTWQTWDQMAASDFQTWVIQQAGTISGLDAAKFKTDFESTAISDKVNAAQADGEKAGISQTPSVFIFVDGKYALQSPLSGPADITAIQALWDLQSRTVKSCPPVTIDKTKSYSAVLHTDKGDITINLFADKAPLTVNSFIYLAQQGWFNNIPWHRVVDGFVAQTGDPTGTGMGSPGYEFGNEIDPSLAYDKAGMVGMANAGAGTNGSQFFITFAAAPTLTGHYTIFGQVADQKSMDVLNSLTKVDPTQANQPTPSMLLSVEIIVN